ncbi:CopG family transcriptional regulator [Nitrosomonas ureae]|uniref:Antitoxin CcdA n=1 Tax=Nitrosomonas ureae TaxID=44577 RepID=A0A286AM80_9PROT|nr:CopG family transcriptional regulator [Nitrosomonas ureae]SOD22982.1 antitoxin CcdA [Nitrosomonas ureae]
MTNRATITISDECWEYLGKVAGDNRSAYINDLLNKDLRNYQEQKAIQDNIEEAEDLDYQNELAEWDVTLMDGIPNE